MLQLSRFFLFFSLVISTSLTAVNEPPRIKLLKKTSTPLFTRTCYSVEMAYQLESFSLIIEKQAPHVAFIEEMTNTNLFPAICAFLTKLNITKVGIPLQGLDDVREHIKIPKTFSLNQEQEGVIIQLTNNNAA